MAKYNETAELLLDNKFDFMASEAAKVLKVYQDNPTLAVGDLLQLEDGIPWHQRLALKIAWECPNNIFIWSRGSGKTFFDAFYALLSAMLYPNEKIGIFSASFRQAKFVWAELEKLYQNSPILQEFAEKRPMSPPDKCTFALKNGSIIEALPLGDGQKIRGARYFRIIGDEAAQIPESIFDIVIRGMTATNRSPMQQVKKLALQDELLRKGLIKEEDMEEELVNRTCLTSTAFYRFNHLWDRILTYENEIIKPENKHLDPKILVNNGTDGTRIMYNKERSVVMFDYNDPPKGFMSANSIKEARLKMSEASFRMEYCAFFPPDSEGFYKRSKLEEARNHEKFSVEIKGSDKHNYVLGIDVARKSDNFAITVGRVQDKSLEIVNVITLNNKSFNVMHKTIRDVLKKYHVIYICMDSQGGGAALEDLLANPDMVKNGEPLIYDSVNNPDKEGLEGRHILEMVKFSDDSIPKMADKMRADLDHKRLLLPAIPGRIIKISDQMSQKEIETKTIELEELEEYYQEIEELLNETTSITASATRTGKIHIGLPSEIMGSRAKDENYAGLISPRKDRWTSCMLCVNAWHAITNPNHSKKTVELATGFAL